MTYVLDPSKKQSFQLSNDAFFYLLEGEDPLEEENLEEAQEVLAYFPNGYQIENNWFAIQGTDLIECEIIPYIVKPQENFDYDEFSKLTSNCDLQLKYLSKDCVKIWKYTISTGERSLMGEFKIYRDGKHPYFHTCATPNFVPGKGCLFFLKDFKKRGS